MINGVRLAQGRLCGDCAGITVAKCTRWIACMGQTLPRKGVRWAQGGAAWEQCRDDTERNDKYNKCNKYNKYNK